MTNIVGLEHPVSAFPISQLKIKYFVGALIQFESRL